jgi:hypothetical protein
MSAAHFVARFTPLIGRVDEAAYPHFNIYPPCVQPIVPFVKDAPRPKKARKSHKELHNEVALQSPTTISEHPTAADRVSRRPDGLTIIAKKREVFEEQMPLSPTPTVPPLRLRRNVASLNQLNGGNYSPPLLRFSPAFDSFPSIDTRLSQSEDEATEPLDAESTALARSQSLPVRPTTPKRRQSALITQKIKALNATIDSPDPDPDPVFYRPVRRLTRSLPISATKS